MANLLANVTNLWLDILLGTILVFNIINGIRRGALRSLFSLIGWGVAVICAFLAQPIAASFVRDYTPVYDIVYDSVKNGMPADLIGKSSIILTQYLKLPTVLNDLIKKTTASIAYSLTESITVLCINILTFVMIVLVIKLIIFLLNEVIKQSHKIAIIKGIDRFFGILVGAAKGIIMIAVILALLVPVVTITQSTFLSKSISESRITKIAYDRNYIFLLMKQVGGLKNKSGTIPMEDIENSVPLKTNIIPQIEENSEEQ